MPLPILILILVVSVILNASSSILGGFYNRRTAGLKGTSTLHTFIQEVTICAFWVVRFILDGCAMDVGVIPYIIGLSVCFFGAQIGFITALRTGSNLISTLLLQTSSILSTIYGFIFWGDTATFTIIAGLILVIIAIFLCLFNGKKEDGKFSVTWLINILIVFVGNAGCGIIMKEQQIAFNDMYGPFLMMVTLAICAVFALVLWLMGDRSDTKAVLKKNWYFPVAGGLANGLMNLLGLITITKLPTAVVFPVKSVGALMLVTLCSAFIFKEKLRWWQWIGILVGSVAVVLLSL